MNRVSIYHTAPVQVGVGVLMVGQEYCVDVKHLRRYIMIRCGKDGAVLTCCHVLDHGEKPEVLALINDNDEPVEWGEQTYVCAACNNAFLNHKTGDDIPDDLCVVHKGCLEQVERKEWWK